MSSHTTLPPSMNQGERALEAAENARAWPEVGLEMLERIASLVDSGGPVVAVLLLLSTVALAVILIKWWQFSHLQIESRRAVDSALACWLRRDTSAAIAAVEGKRQPSAQLVLLALQGIDRFRAADSTLREELTRVASLHIENLRSHLRTLEIIATLSPLLGLLGTVMGMIEAFQQLEAAGNRVNPALLSGGIWQALLTTALGLSVAIPVVLAHSWLERKVERCRHTMEDAVTRVFTRDLQYAGETAPLAVPKEGAEGAT